MNSEFKALSDPTRREILKLLKQKDLTAGEIAAQFKMSKPAISKHLDILKNAQLIDVERQGQFLYYSLNTTALQNVLQSFLSFFDGVKEGEQYEKQKL